MVFAVTCKMDELVLGNILDSQGTAFEEILQILYSGLGSTIVLSGDYNCRGCKTSMSSNMKVCSISDAELTRPR